MITVLFWKWNKDKYRSVFTADHVNIAAAMVARNTTLPVRFVCITDDSRGIAPHIRTIKLWDNPAPEYGNSTRPNCLCRLRAFSAEMVDLLKTEKLVWLDLDMVVTGNIDNILGAPEDFAMWGDTHPRLRQYNGSLCVMKPGAYSFVWDDFKGLQSLQQAHAAGFFGSDQAWISYKMGHEHRKFTTEDGVYSYKNHYREMNKIAMIEGCSLVFFHGQYDPWHESVQSRHPWVKEHYRL